MKTDSPTSPLEEIPTSKKRSINLPDQEELQNHSSPEEQPYIVFELVSGREQKQKRKKGAGLLAHVGTDIFRAIQPQYPALLSTLAVIELSKETALEEFLLLEGFRDMARRDGPSIYSIRISRPLNFSFTTNLEELTDARRIEVGTGYIHHETLTRLPSDRVSSLLREVLEKADVLEVTLNTIDGRVARKELLLSGD